VSFSLREKDGPKGLMRDPQANFRPLIIELRRIPAPKPYRKTKFTVTVVTTSTGCPLRSTG